MKTKTHLNFSVNKRTLTLGQHCWDVFSRILPIKSNEHKYLECPGVRSANSTRLPILLHDCLFFLSLFETPAQFNSKYSPVYNIVEGLEEFKKLQQMIVHGKTQSD